MTEAEGAAGDLVSADKLVTALFEIIDDGRWDDLGRVLAEDCICRPVGSAPLVGLERIERYYRHERAIASGRHKMEKVVGDLSAAACWGSFTGTTKGGEDINISVAEAFVLRDAKIVWRTTYFRPTPALPQDPVPVAAQPDRD
jgi:uncharacterized protein